MAITISTPAREMTLSAVIIGHREVMYAEHRYAVSYGSREPMNFHITKTIADQINPSTATTRGYLMIDDRALPMPTPAWIPTMLNTAFTMPATSPMTIMNTSGPPNPPVFGISRKKAAGDVITLIAVRGIALKSIPFVSSMRYSLSRFFIFDSGAHIVSADFRQVSRPLVRSVYVPWDHA